MKEMEELEEDSIKRILIEIDILKKLDHCMIIKYRDSFKYENKFYIIMDLASGIYIYWYIIYWYIYIYIYNI